MLERYEEALADFDRAIALDANSDWDRYCRATIHFLMQNMSVCDRDLNFAIDLAQENATRSTDPVNRWQCDFNRALYLLFAGKQEEAFCLYQQGIASCDHLPCFQGALTDLLDLQQIQPHHHQIQAIHQLLQDRLTQLGSSKKVKRFNASTSEGES